MARHVFVQRFCLNRERCRTECLLLSRPNSRLSRREVGYHVRVWRFAMLKRLAILFFVASAVLPAMAQLALSVKTDRERYRISDEIRMESQLLNTGPGDVYLWTWDLC